MSDDSQSVARLKPQVGWRLWVNVVLLCVGLFLSALETTIIATALVSIASSLGEYHRSNWIVISYLLTYTAFLTIFARCSDVFGRKPMVFAGCIIFTGASLACGLARTMTQLIIFRAFQGLGGAGLYSLSLRVLTEIPSGGAMGPVAGLIGIVFACSSIAGPLLGGAITSSTTWRWVFYLNVPAGAVIILVAIFVFPDNEKPLPFKWNHFSRVDWLGGILSFAAVGLLIFALEAGGSEYRWGAAIIIISFAVSSLCLVLFVVWEARLGRRNNTRTLPIFPSRLVANHYFTVSLLTACLIGFPFMITIIYLPQRFQVVSSLSTIRAGIDMIPLLILSALGSGLGGALCSRKHIENQLLSISMGLQVIGLGLLWSSHSIGPVTASQYGYECILGLGFGLSLSTVVIVARRSVHEDDQSISMGFITQIRVLGGLIGVACTQTLSNNITGRDLKSILEPAQIKALQDSIASISTLSQVEANAVREVYSQSFKSQTLVALSFAGAGFLVSLGMLRAKSVHNEDSEKASETCTSTKTNEQNERDHIS